ncbi:tRNA pseudouridine(55) synthase TruB [Novosphingobium mangrovi (ex Huang et al. 2023)]|uniref:tRNA pseudouridine synthase B n=1 Tax=Novosphingobium mangrovi (ex Huang et al. 2023) TaxID=2976432 RepID=A0ABT2I1Z8_9SPHN|nr:tRNA pseudouridine(55) synthase TruB [Novosphingobium mangrovi (ex Huang et al. 2023)]MCT2398831.1 tRNA pseudouridine(55) synthase TruB [Novosphingobium mangrovi (ex Huang et al. 2023)]
MTLPPTPHGWIILDKPIGLGSTQAVAAVKRNLREAGYGKKTKVGHGGTLDPLASGILPIALGEATKLTGRMLDASKIYEFTVQFGRETDTLDLEGAVIAESDVRPTRDQVEAVLSRFTGPIEQVPPAYSALKVDGQRAYDLARAGEDVKLKSRSVEIFALSLLPFRGGAGGGASPRSAVSADGPHPTPSPEGEGLQDVTFRAHVSKGTYIRSLARDIAHALGTCGTVTMLRRVKAGPFDLSHAISLDKLNETGKGAPLEQILLPLEAGLDDIPAIDLSPEQARAVRQGRVLTGLPQEDGLHWVREGRVPVALMELSGGDARVVRGFNLSDVAE